MKGYNSLPFLPPALLTTVTAFWHLRRRLLFNPANLSVYSCEIASKHKQIISSVFKRHHLPPLGATSKNPSMHQWQFQGVARGALWELRHLRSAARGDLAVPATRTLWYGLRSLAVAGPSTWNSLPASLVRYAAVILHPRSVVIWKLNRLSERITSTLVTVSSCKSART